MHRTTLLAALIVVALSSCVIVPVPALTGIGRQNSAAPPPTEQPSEMENPIKLSVSLINVFVTVLDKNHEILTDLKQDDFKIFEDSREQKIALFSKRAKTPMTTALLVDTSLSERYLLGVEQEAASRFVHKVLTDGDEATVISFDSDATLLADFTEDTAIVDRAIHQTAVKAPIGSAGTVLYDAVYLGCHRLRDQAGRKLLVVFTDGDDYGSRINLEEAVEAAQRANTAIFIFLIADPRFSSGFGFGSRGEVVAKIMTDETGGRTIEIRSEANLSKAAEELSDEMHLQYVVGYYPTNTKHDGTFRSIRVKTDTHGATVLARRGYYASGD